MNRNRRHAFTLVELLVVIGIIAVLIGILLPSLTRARDQANTVACASNLRQLHNAFVLYAQSYANYCLPAQAANGSSDNWWLGINTLGHVLGMHYNPSDPNSKQAVIDRMARMLDCPSVTRDKIPGLTFSFDYTYNANLGDIRGQDPNNSSYKSYHPAHAFKKWNQVPGNVLVMCDSHEPIVKNDERFDALNELTYKKAYAGHPHTNKKMANCLFHDGSVRLCKAYTPIQGMAITSGSPPSGVPQSAYTDLADWMIKHPGHLDPNSVNKASTKDDVWQPGRPLPFN